MDLETLPVLSLTEDPERFSAGIGASFRAFGFALVRDHGIDPLLIAEAWRLTAEFFALPKGV
jgi:isopenicillin N synthase-like dioxygenase